MRAAACALLGALCALTPALANPPAAPTAQEQLETNERLVDRARVEAMEYRASLLGRDPDPVENRRLEALEAKLKVLEERSVELRALLPLQQQAGGFLQDLVSRRLAEEAKRRLDLEEMEASLKQMHERALELVSQDRLREAAALYEEILLRDPEDDEAYMILGHTSVLMGRYDRAEQAFANAVHIDPANAAEIVPFYENLILQEPSAEHYTHLGYAHLIAGDIVASKRAFEEALRIDPLGEAAERGLSILES
ncbi:MAG: hypothetical protein MOGMAGMI_00792 [Candidatus Omnitrophica bacterium]|nr:hypothetical protein [Candidatus Omnitrophota bacterium]